MNAAELFVKCLEQEGTKFIFGLPGEENAHFMMALEKSSIKFIMTRHEQAAAFMAETYGKLTGEAGVCLATLGPGATNLVTGVASANSDRSPMVVITGQADSQRQHKESHQHIDVVSLFRPITKWATPIIHPDNIPEVVRRAFKQATREKPGACHIEISDDIAALPAAKNPVRVNYLRRSVADDKIVNMAMATIRGAKNPVILAGNGTIRTRASKQLRIFTEMTGIPVVSTFMGKGCVSREADECLFTIGLQTRNLANAALDAADAVITVGYDLVEYPPRGWNKWNDKKIVHIDFLPAVVDINYQLEVEVVGDLAHTLWMMNERIRANPQHWESKYMQATRAKLKEVFAEHRDDDTEGIVRPQKALWDVRKALGPNDILLSDVGSHKMWVAQYYHCDEPNTCLIPNGFCSMGCALPGAIAAKLVHPERRVMALCGDGGFLMNVQEMETAVRYKANIVVMVWVDNGYNLIEWKQSNEFGHHTELSFGNPDFVQLADAFGCKGIKVGRSRDLAAAIEEAFDADKPAIIAVPIDYRENDRLNEKLRIIV
ncbi:MAG: acetolactate synthase large subunit [Candidatus Hydrogenedens sp.]|nr:acetolactate synthase large subunit [Candidatus Hydrogenedentota bacterium]NLF58778.1 acetolactate synthase large subunit [Candidatus Hydrogenedens sp.]